MDSILPISKYERARLIGQRATQLSKGSPPTIDCKGMTDPVKIAEKEYNLGKIPLNIIRNMPNGEKIQISILTK